MESQDYRERYDNVIYYNQQIEHYVSELTKSKNLLEDYETKFPNYSDPKYDI